MSKPQTFEATGDMVILSRDDYEAMLKSVEDMADIRAFDDGIAEIEAGFESLPGSFVKKLIDTDSPVREWRIYRSLSQTALANAVGVRQATISAIESGSAPRLDTARRLAEVLECDLDALF